MTKPTLSPPTLKILELRADNVKRIKAVHIRPDGSLVVLGGENGAGKSSVLDAITMALGGKGAAPPEPLRRGTDAGEIILDLGEYVVRRTYLASGQTTLTVSNKDGAKFQSPQSMLDAIVGQVTFDPLLFVRADPKARTKMLRELLGLDFGAIDTEREKLYDERGRVNKVVAQLKADLDRMPVPADTVPDEPVSSAALAAELKQAHAHNREIERAGRALTDANSRLDLANKRISDLRRQLEMEEQALPSILKQVQDARDAAGKPTIDTKPIEEQMATIDSTNVLVAAKKARGALAEAHAKKQLESEALTGQIENLDQTKAEAIATSKMPVAGLGFAADGTVTMNGLPIEQASQAEQIRISVAIGLAMHPRLRVLLIRDASLLDEKSLALVAEMAAAADAQVWLERWQVDSQTTVVIEDGVSIQVQR